MTQESTEKHKGSCESLRNLRRLVGVLITIVVGLISLTVYGIAQSNDAKAYAHMQSTETNTKIHDLALDSARQDEKIIMMLDRMDEMNDRLKDIQTAVKKP